MTLALVLLLASVRPLRFPLEPIQSEMARGEKLYYQRRGIDRTLLEDRVAVGKWFDGQRKVDTDQIIWLSPSLVSRWLGYLNAKEKWSKSELLNRWNSVSTALDGRMTFVVEMYALPKQGDAFEITSGAPSRPETATDLKFLVTYLTDQERDETQHVESLIGAKRHQSPLERQDPSIMPKGVFRGYSLDAIQKWPWFSLDDTLSSMAPQLATTHPTVYDAVVGDHVRAVYIIQADLPEKPLAWGKFEVRVFAPGKEPIARFDLGKVGR